MISGGQLILLLLAVVAFLAGGGASLLERAGKKIPPGVRWFTLFTGIVCALGLLVWHSSSVATPSWEPLQDNLSAMLTLAILLSVFVAYIQLKRPIPLLEWLVMPLVVLLLLMAGHFGQTHPDAYIASGYSLAHRVFTFTGALAFVVSGATGVLYLLSQHALRARKAGKHLPPAPRTFGSLERLEHLTYSTVTLGFALFTLGIAIGVAWALHDQLGRQWHLVPKYILALSVWGVFAVVLHAPIAPRLRGRKTAILSIVGLLLTLATLLAVLLATSGGAD